MKRMQWLMLVATVALPLFTGFAQTPAPQVPALSPAAAEVVKLAQSGTSDDVLLAYIQGSPSSFSLSADQILYLRDVGVSSTAISAMLNRDQALRNQPQQYSYEQRQYGPSTTAAAAPVAAAPVANPAPAPAEPTPPPPAPTTAPATVAVAAPAPVYVSTPPPDVTYFYQDLSPYGTWVELPDYGWCWQPTVVVVNHGWRPYCDSGHWVWTDSGWYWVSDYSWGWAPFHYGRWYMHERCGWVWVPDRVWGPAWVTWRTSGDYCGWAPLPPRAVFDVRLGWCFNGVHVGVDFDFGLHADHFCFIGFGDFCSHDLGHHRIPPHEVTRVYNHTTIINNYTINNTTVINHGVKVERVAAATHTEIHKTVIRDLPAGSNPAARQGVQKGTQVVYRPQLHAPTKPVTMTAQKLDANHPVIQHTEVSAIKTSIKSTPASTRTAATTARTSYQPETPRLTTRSATEKPTAVRSQPAVSNTRQALPSTSPTPVTTHTVEAPKPETRMAATSAPATPKASTAVTRRVEDDKPATRALPNYTTAQQPTYPLHTSPKTWNTPNSSGETVQNAHAYYPKTYQQSADVRSLPPLNHGNSASASTGSGPSSKKHQN